MTVASEVASVSYPGTGGVGPFPVPFRFFVAADLSVVVRSVTDVETILVLGADYTVAGAGNPSGSITLTLSLPVGQTVEIRRAAPYTQPTSLRNQSSFFAASHEDAFDRVVMLVQQLHARLIGVENGTAPVAGSATFTQLDVAPGTSSLEDVTATRGTFTGLVQVIVNGVTTKLSGLAAAANALVRGGWLSGHTDGLNITPNDDGVAGAKVVLAYLNDNGYQSAVEFANVSGTALATVLVTPPATFLNGIAVDETATISALRISGGPQSPASNAIGTPGEVRWDTGFLYVCTATNTWKRVALTGGY